MKILFTKSNKILSKAIRYIAQEPVSHTAIQLGDLVFHANLLGVHIQSAKRFREECMVVYELEAPVETAPYLTMAVDNYNGSYYDFGGFAFLGICLFLNRRFGMKMPKNNAWQDKHMFICTEFVSMVVQQKVDSMITPYALYLTLKETWRV